MNAKTSVYLQLATGTFFWGLNFHLAQISIGYLSSIGASAGRYVFAAIGILVFYPFFARKRVTREMWHKSKQNAGWIILTGLCGVFFFNYYFFKGLETAEAINGALIIALNPVFTLVFSMFMLKARVSKIQLAGILVSLVGVAIVLSQGNISTLLTMSFNIGDFYLLIASILFSFHNVLIQKFLNWINPILLTLFTNCLAAILFVIISFPELYNVPSGHLDLPFWLSVSAMGIFGTAMGFVFWNNGVRQIGAGNTAMFLNLVPVYAAITGIFFNNYITIYQLAGGVFIGYGIYLSIKGNKRAQLQS